MSKQRINLESVVQPEQLVALLNAMDTEIDAIRVLINELRADLLTARTPLIGDSVLSGAGLAIGTTKDLVANALFMYMINGIMYIKLADAVGVEPGNDVVPQSTYGAVALDIGADGTIDVIEAAANATGYASAVLAIAGIPAVAADHVRMGTVTAICTTGDFTFGTTEFDAGGCTAVFTDNLDTIWLTLGTALTTTAPAVVERVSRQT